MIKYDKSFWVKDAIINIRSASKWGIIFSLAFAALSIVFCAFIYVKGVQNIYIAGGLAGVPDSVVYSMMTIWRKICIILLPFCICLSLLVGWWGIFMKCLFHVYSLIVDLILSKVGLRTRRDIQYFVSRVNHLTPKFIKVKIIGLSIFAISTIVILARNADIRSLCRLGFISILILSVIIALISYVYDWKGIKTKDPNLLKTVYGRKRSLGRFFYTWAWIFYIVFVFRVGLPLLYSSANFVSEKVFVKLAQKVSYSPHVNYIHNYFKNIKKEELIPQFFSEIPEKFSVKQIITKHTADTKLDIISLRKELFDYLYWIGMIFSVIALLVPMVLYNLIIRSGRTVLKKIFEASFMSLSIGVGVPWLISLLFLKPSPSIQGSSLLSVIIFTTYASWRYTK